MLIILAVTAGVPALAKAQVTNPPAPAATDENSRSNCLARLDQLIELVEGLQQGASNDTGRAECIAEKLNSIKSLTELAHAYTTRAEVDDVETAAGDQAMILSACQRGEKLAAEAAICRSDLKHKNKKTEPMAATAATNTSRTVVSAASTTPASAIRDITTCLKQAKLAVLLAQAMGLELSETDVPSRVLAKLGVQPLGGWSGEECVTVDDVCVVVARALSLKVESPENPYSYVQAVRNEGLPVDKLLPRRMQISDPPIVLEAEVRAFLARGYAARLPSSQRLQPD